MKFKYLGTKITLQI